MHHDFLKQLGPLGVTARIKRLSDTLNASIRDLYSSENIDLEPSWHLLLLMLKDEPASPSEIASSLRLSLPGVTAMVRRMTAKGYLQTTTSKQDARKRLVELTPLARKRMPEFERVWSAGSAAIDELLAANPDLPELIDTLERELGAQSFDSRAQSKLKP